MATFSANTFSPNTFSPNTFSIQVEVTVVVQLPPETMGMGFTTRKKVVDQLDFEENEAEIIAQMMHEDEVLIGVFTECLGLMIKHGIIK